MYSGPLYVITMSFVCKLIPTGELKQAIVSMMLRKDEIEEKNRYVGLSETMFILRIPFFASAECRMRHQIL